MDESRPYTLTVYGPAPLGYDRHLVSIDLSAYELMAMLIVMGTSPSMMLDSGKGTEVKEMIDKLNRAIKQQQEGTAWHTE